MNDIGILDGANVLYLGVGILAVIGIGSIIHKLDSLFFKSSGPIQFLLNCDERTAEQVLAGLNHERIEWDKFNADYTLAKGYFLPLYGQVLDDRPIATSFEVEKAFIGAAIRGTYKGGMSNTEMLDVIARELVNFRNDTSPLTSPVRKVDGIVF